MPFKISGGGSFGLPMLGRGRALDGGGGGGGGEALPVTEGLHADYDASTLGLTDGAALTGWPDALGNHDLGSVVGSPIYRAASINGHPAVDFDGASHLKVDFGETLPQPNTIFAVVVNDTHSAAHTIIDGFGSTGRHLIDISTAGALKAFADGGFDFYSTALSTAETYVIDTLFSGASSRLAVNGADEGLPDVGTGGMAGITLGANNGGANRLDGKIARLVVYARALSLEERTSVTNHLMNKYVPTTYTDVVLLDSPQRLYLLDETSGTTAADDGSDGSDGTYLGTYVQGAAPIVADDGASLNFGGTGEVSVPAIAGNSTGFTVEAWINLSVHPTTDGNIQHVARDMGQFMILLNPNGAVYLGFMVIAGSGGSPVVQYPLSNISVGQDYHVVGTWDLSTVRLYVNAVEVASAAFAGDGTLAAGTGLALGNRPGQAQRLNGRGDNMAFYDHALTAARVESHYNSGIG